MSLEILVDKRCSGKTTLAIKKTQHLELVGVVVCNSETQLQWLSSKDDNHNVEILDASFASLDKFLQNHATKNVGIVIDLDALVKPYLKQIDVMYRVINLKIPVIITTQLINLLPRAIRENYDTIIHV